MAWQEKKKSWWPAKILAPPTNFYALLHKQALKTLEGVEALCTWLARGTEEDAQKVRDLEKAADEIRLEIMRELSECFVTPFDPEEIYDLSAKLDLVINFAKAVVREMEALEVKANESSLQTMGELLLEGTRCLQLSFANLKTNLHEAAEQATLARKSENRFNKIYRQATRQLFTTDDVKQILKTHEVYRYMLQAAESIDAVAEKLLYVVIKYG